MIPSYGKYYEFRTKNSKQMISYGKCREFRTKGGKMYGKTHVRVIMKLQQWVLCIMYISMVEFCN